MNCALGARSAIYDCLVVDLSYNKPNRWSMSLEPDVRSCDGIVGVSRLRPVTTASKIATSNSDLPVATAALSSIFITYSRAPLSSAAKIDIYRGSVTAVIVYRPRNQTGRATRANMLVIWCDYF